MPRCNLTVSMFPSQILPCIWPKYCIVINSHPMGSLTDIFTKITLSHLDNKGEAKNPMTSLMVQSKQTAKIKIECALSVQILKAMSVSITRTFIPLCFSWLQVYVCAGFPAGCSRLAHHLRSVMMEQVYQGAVLLWPEQLDSVLCFYTLTTMWFQP